MPMTKTLEEIKKEKEEEYKRRFLDYFDDGSKNPDTKLFNLIGEFVREVFDLAYTAGVEAEKKKCEADYKDICNKCRGKGYSTQLEFYGGHGEADIGLGDVTIKGQMPYYRPCSCDRGKQFKEAIEAENKACEEVAKIIAIDMLDKTDLASETRSQIVLAIKQRREND